MHAHAHTAVHAHAHTHCCTHTCTHCGTHARTHCCARARTHPAVFTHPRAHTHTVVDAYAHTSLFVSGRAQAGLQPWALTWIPNPPWRDHEMQPNLTRKLGRFGVCHHLSSKRDRCIGEELPMAALVLLAALASPSRRRSGRGQGQVLQPQPLPLSIVCPVERSSSSILLFSPCLGRSCGAGMALWPLLAPLTASFHSSQAEAELPWAVQQQALGGPQRFSLLDHGILRAQLALAPSASHSLPFQSPKCLG